MKYIKMYEYIVGSSGVYKFDDGYLKIFQIVEGPNRGKTSFRFRSDDSLDGYDSCSFMLGASKILDTDYINEPNIRNIKLIESRHKILMRPTKHNVIMQFFYDLGYDKELDRDFLRKRYSEIEYIYTEMLMNISLTSETLGEVFDRVKKLRDNFFENETEIFKNYQIQKDTDKYNL